MIWKVVLTETRSFGVRRGRRALPKAEGLAHTRAGQRPTFGQSHSHNCPLLAFLSALCLLGASTALGQTILQPQKVEERRSLFGAIKEMKPIGEKLVYTFQNSPTSSVFLASSPDKSQGFGHLFYGSEADVGAFAYNPMTGMILVGSDLSSNRLLVFDPKKGDTLANVSKTVPEIAHYRTDKSIPYISGDRVWILDKRDSSSRFIVDLYRQNTVGALSYITSEGASMLARTAVLHNNTLFVAGNTVDDLSKPETGNKRTDFSVLAHSGSSTLILNPLYVRTTDDNFLGNMIVMDFNPNQNPYSGSPYNDRPGRDIVAATDNGKVLFLSPWGYVPEARIIETSVHGNRGGVTSITYSDASEGLFITFSDSLDIGFVPMKANDRRATPAYCAELQDDISYIVSDRTTASDGSTGLWGVQAATDSMGNTVVFAVTANSNAYLRVEGPFTPVPTMKAQPLKAAQSHKPPPSGAYVPQPSAGLSCLQLETKN